MVSRRQITVAAIAVDRAGNTAHTILGQGQFSGTDSAAGPPDNYRFAPADGSVATLAVALLTEGSQQLQVHTVGVPDFRANPIVTDPAGFAGFAADLSDLFFGQTDLGLQSLLPGQISSRLKTEH
jgi:hypothetical protein